MGNFLNIYELCEVLEADGVKRFEPFTNSTNCFCYISRPLVSVHRCTPNELWYLTIKPSGKSVAFFYDYKALFSLEEKVFSYNPLTDKGLAKMLAIQCSANMEAAFQKSHTAKTPSPRKSPPEKCPKCGDVGEWRNMALICRKGHGVFQG